MFLWLNAVCVCVLDLSYPPGMGTIPDARQDSVSMVLMLFEVNFTDKQEGSIFLDNPS